MNLDYIFILVILVVFALTCVAIVSVMLAERHQAVLSVFRLFVRLIERLLKRNR